MNLLTKICALLFLVSPLFLKAQRAETLMEKNWKFTREDDSAFSSAGYNDTQWQTVHVPHDWAICGPFSKENDQQETIIRQDGQKEARVMAGRTGGLPFTGVGWYRTHFKSPVDLRNKSVTLLFDGAMSNATVFVNGKKAGNWPYGYNSFYLDVTPYLNPEGDNVVAVRLENLPESSRWYPGAGLYRNVHLIVTGKTHIPVWGTYITTPEADEQQAKVVIRTKIEQPADAELSLQTAIADAAGNIIKTVTTRLTGSPDSGYLQELNITRPSLWYPEHPYLYKVYSRLYKKGRLVDVYTTSFGIRSISLVPGKGFFLNGKNIKFKGVCNHHDLGPLGAAMNEAAIRRQVRILKDMGANAIRTSHNMPAPELVKACDEMGMLLMAESFDEWETPKMKNGYHLFFKDWAEKDLVNLVHHYRNNPSVVLWSIGNEIPDQGTARGRELAKYLQDICHREDPTRPVTQGMDNMPAALANGMAQLMDIPGFNYRTFLYQKDFPELPQQLLLGTETVSTVSSRGIYEFPVARYAMKTYPNHQSSSYDLEYCSWSDLPEDNFIMQDDLRYAMGEFVWTGFDYLGEPTPYYYDWPNHSSLFGIIDLAGIPKDRFYLYRSLWQKKKETLHILPHWNWPGKEGQVIPVFVYTSYPSAELFINGKSQGRRTKDTSFTVFNTGDEASAKKLDRQKRYRLMWMDTRYEPGVVKVVAYDKNNRPVAEQEMRTAGKPDHIELAADRTTIKADGKDISFITVKIVDRQGNFCSQETRTIHFKASGSGTYKAAANGNPISLEPFQAPQMQLFSGQLTALVQSSETPGIITFEASAEGVKSGTLKIRTSK
ncbi:beta-galactosidase [Niabella ginsenosidivorans]|uniref:Beta-galactosidase n=1 Tax=Niabella ginsenosidivorans TaxID=1176587 RepID=A0A1A9I3W6_9BACT|nr:glycoside hydrolase family 2 TIM barrel-domain containing protein [Niabella ginsenosidivorans]ANH81382.1 beta-galactosidase [Niabella ginsenosidivorans]